METGKVTSEESGLIRVELPRSPHCSSCRACSIVAGADTVFTYAKNSCKAKPGDTVALERIADNELKASLILFAVPLAVFTAAILLCAWLIENERIAIGIAAFCLVASYVAVYFYSKHHQRKYCPFEAVKIVEE